MENIMALLFALAVSLDGLGVGLAYGMRKVKIPLRSMAVICGISTLIIIISMLLGKIVQNLVNPQLAENLGALILFLVGVWIILESFSDRWKTAGVDEILLNVKIPPLGIAVQVLKEPQRADIDRSGTINGKEAQLLGLALALDSLGAGFGMAVSGGSLWKIPLLVGGLNFVLVSGGLWLGARWGKNKTIFGSLAPGLLLILLAVLKFKIDT